MDFLSADLERADLELTGDFRLEERTLPCGDCDRDRGDFERDRGDFLESTEL